jgi:hypothetical protein
MVQTATLSDVSHSLFCDSATVPARETPAVARSLAVACSGLGEFVVAGLMLILAPFILLSLAVAFVIACLRLQMFDMESDARAIGERASVSTRMPVAPRLELRKIAMGRSRFLNTSSEHLWN